MTDRNSPNPRRRERLTVDEEAAIVELVGQDKSDTEIAKLLAIASKTVARYRHDNNIERPAKATTTVTVSSLRAQAANLNHRADGLETKANDLMFQVSELRDRADVLIAQSHKLEVQVEDASRNDA